MSENAKKIGLIVITIVALAGAVFGAMRLFGEEKMEVQNTVPMPAGYKSEKQRMLEEQQGTQAQPPASGKDADLGGSIQGGQ